MGAWIEIATQELGDSAEGAWIEILTSCPKHTLSAVAPLVGAWIEMPDLGYSEAAGQLSLPLRECGLKYRFPYPPSACQPPLPLLGATGLKICIIMAEKRIVLCFS